MKEKILALVLCGALAMTLFACGEKRGNANDSDVLGDEQHSTNGTTNGTTNGANNGTNSGTANNGTTNNGTTNNGTTNNGTTNGDSSTAKDASRRVITGNNAKDSDVMGDSALRGSTINPANGTADRTVTWEQMLQNGRVHDKDGFLFDGENSHWS